MRRQLAALAVSVLALAGCSDPAPKFGEIGAIEGFVGGAIVEEPRAALVARDILSAGGTAADAATAAFFTLTVTYPVAVGLGGGGACLYYDRSADKVETVDFRLRPPENGGAIWVPGALRGMAMLHSRYGRIRWSQLLSPAEKSARFGHRISRALAKRIAPQAARLKNDDMAAGLFLHPDGTPKGEAEDLVQVELAATLTRIRTRGVGDLYGGEAGRRLQQSALAHGGKMTITDLRGYRAVWRKSATHEVGNHMLHVPTFGSADQLDNPALKLINLASGNSGENIAVKVFRQADIEMSVDRGEGGFVIGDSFGSAAACVYQMNGAFGSGKMAPNLGLFLAPATKRGDATWPGYPLPLLGVNEPLGQAVMAAVGTGGPKAAAAAVRVSLATMGQGAPLAKTMAGKNGAGVQALWCPKGIRVGPKTCRFATDPKGFGLAVFDKF
ncbi:MAG: hypothetical protein HOK21_08790 [Rhodospirillaceae bacterium]|nr:hypothetical protein [Rhodospirillaceae bacterium]MBT4686526.1 hypothetical protein [Rhodospirillaceae bacterium]MBT5082668.1 hypothetical protein [Rhodospirillaceae bacterium]MBT5524168.1 hypothetical protein [Rhodospirillaceae bacterium]MBT5879760.1 hypothetical protein [Rhodospirillaceae bacterium]